MNIAAYRKFVVAACAATVTLAHAFGVVNADEISTEVIGIFDAIAAILVYAVPNASE